MSTQMLSEEEHIARAMLLGLHYHGGNGEPFYYAKDADGTPDPSSFIDAVTLKKFVNPDRDVFSPIDWPGLTRRAKAKRLMQQEEKIEWLK